MRTFAADIVQKEGQEITLYGWVHSRRDHGKIIFIDLRDRSGLAQVVFTPEIRGASDLRLEYVVDVGGVVKKRPPAMMNEKLPTGEYEVAANTLTILSVAKELPIPVDSVGYDINEEMRLRYRYLDLRRERLLKNMKLRHEFNKFVRTYLSEKGFIEVETPMLTKSTPEGSRDFLVPSRMHPGKFYALPQSPQQYKQLLMIAGFERYFQLAKAMRDEDLRANRSFEHTQIDLEMSFVEQRDVMELVEGLMTALFEHFGKKITRKPFPIHDYREVMQKFGDEHIDIRNDTGDANEMGLAWIINFPVFVKDKETGRLTYSHNPFTAPRPEDEKKLIAGSNLAALLSLQYDLMCNGEEIGGGGIRIRNPETLKKVFETLGHSEEKIQKQFGHILEAFRYGVPPHGGIALGVDRILMMLTGEDSLREVIPFPMTSGGQTAVMDAPSEVDKKQLDELGLELRSAARRKAKK